MRDSLGPERRLSFTLQFLASDVSLLYLAYLMSRCNDSQFVHPPHHAFSLACIRRVFFYCRQNILPSCFFHEARQDSCKCRDLLLMGTKSYFQISNKFNNERKKHVDTIIFNCCLVGFTSIGSESRLTDYSRNCINFFPGYSNFLAKKHCLFKHCGKLNFLVVVIMPCLKLRFCGSNRRYCFCKIVTNFLHKTGHWAQYCRHFLGQN